MSVINPQGDLTSLRAASAPTGSRDLLELPRSCSCAASMPSAAPLIRMRTTTQLSSCPHAVPGTPRWPAPGRWGSFLNHEPYRLSPLDPRHAPAGGRDRRPARADHGRAREGRRRRQRAGARRSSMNGTQIVVLGSGTGGTMVANRLRRRFGPDQAEIHVVDRDDLHVYQPGLLFVPFGMAQLDEIVRPRRRQLRDGIVFHETRDRGRRPRRERRCPRGRREASVRRPRCRERRAPPA